MTSADFIDKWTNALTGVAFRHSYGIQSKLTDRDLVHKIEECVRKMLIESKEIEQSKPIAQPGVRGRC